MPWIQQKPEHTCKLSEAMPLFSTSFCRILAEGYQALLEQNRGAIPTKSGFDVLRFTKIIPHLALCAIKKPDQCIFRVAGEGFKQRLGLNPTGLNYYDFVPADRRAHAVRAMNMVIDVPCAFRVDVERHYSNGLSAMVEAIGLPLLSDESDVDGFIIFADEGLDLRPELTLNSSRLFDANVTHRDLIDLGFGVDKTFVDLVWDA